MSVGRICTREVDLAAADETVLGAARRMRDERVGTLVILNEAREPIGLVTDRDLVVRVLVAGKDPQTTRVGHVMTQDLRVISEESPIEAALALMRAAAVRRLPVVDRLGKLVGIVSLDDVLELLVEEFGHIGRILERQRTAAAGRAGSG